MQPRDRARLLLRKARDDEVAVLKLSGVVWPEVLDDVRGLNPFAVTVRYGDLSDEPEEPFDRGWAIESVRRMLAWAEGTVL